MLVTMSLALASPPSPPSPDVFGQDAHDLGYPGVAYLHPKIHFTPDVVSNHGGWHDIAGCITHKGVHHVFQGTGWNHARSTDLVHWESAAHGPHAIRETYAGMDSLSDPCSGFLTKDPQTGSICAGFRQCGSSKGVNKPGAKPWDVPLELRCALDADLEVWNDTAPGYSPEYLFNVSFWRGIPYDPARPWREADGKWYQLISMDGCNASGLQRLPCHKGGMLSLWSSPCLRGTQADWQHVGDVFETNATVLSDGFLSKEFVTIDYIGKLEGDPQPEAAGGTGTRLFLNNVGGNGGGDGCCSGTTSYFVVEQEAGGVMKEVAPGQLMADWGSFSLRPLPTPYDPLGTLIPSSKGGEFILSGGASVVFSSSRADNATSGANLRSGNPGGMSTIQFGSGIGPAPAHMLDAVSLSFRYIAGYSAAPGAADGSTLSVLLQDENYTVVRTLLTTGPLTNYSYDRFTTYSPPIAVNATNLRVPNDGLLHLVLQVTNHGHNLQFPLDDKSGGMQVHVRWVNSPPAAVAIGEGARRGAQLAPASGPMPHGLGLLSGTASRGLSMARTLGSEAADQVSQLGRKVLIGWTGPAPGGMPQIGNSASAQSLPRELSLAPDRSLLQVYAALPDECATSTTAADACGVSVLGDGAKATTITLMPWIGLVAVDATMQGNPTVRGGPLPPACTLGTCGVAGGWRIHVMVDHSVIEVIVNNATAFVVYAVPASESATQVAVLGKGGSAEVWPLRSANNM